MRKALSIMLVAAATAAVSLLSASCKKTIPTLTVTPTAVSIDVAGGTKTLAVSSNVAWTATSSQSCCRKRPQASGPMPRGPASPASPPISSMSPPSFPPASA